MPPFNRAAAPPTYPPAHSAAAAARAGTTRPRPVAAHSELPSGDEDCSQGQQQQQPQPQPQPQQRSPHSPGGTSELQAADPRPLSAPPTPLEAIYERQGSAASHAPDGAENGNAAHDANVDHDDRDVHYDFGDRYGPDDESDEDDRALARRTV
jgi:hypothetical protein